LKCLATSLEARLDKELRELPQQLQTEAAKVLREARENARQPEAPCCAGLGLMLSGRPAKGSHAAQAPGVRCVAVEGRKEPESRRPDASALEGERAG